MRGLFSLSWSLLGLSIRAFVWSMGTVWLGAVALVRGAETALRLPAVLSNEVRCPRGHRFPSHGIFVCTCGATHEGWAFGRCRVCAGSCGWVVCRSCGLPIENPLRRLL